MKTISKQLARDYVKDPLNEKLATRSQMRLPLMLWHVRRVAGRRWPVRGPRWGPR
jgi:hypothetical protein